MARRRGTTRAVVALAASVLATPPVAGAGGHTAAEPPPAMSAPSTDADAPYVITTAAGEAAVDFLGRALPDTSGLGGPTSVFVEPGGTLLVAESLSHEVSRVDPSTGEVTRLTGTGTRGTTGDGGPATAAQLEVPVDAVADADGTVFILESARLRRIDPVTGTITTLMGRGPLPGGLVNATDLHAEPDGSLLITSAGAADIDEYSGVTQLGGVTVRRWRPDGTVTLVAGVETNTPIGGWDGQYPWTPACRAESSVELCQPSAAWGDGEGGVLVADEGRLRHVRPGAPTVTVSELGGLTGAAPGPDSTVLSVDGQAVVHRGTIGGTPVVIAGEVGTQGYDGDHQLATQALLARPMDVAVAPDGTVYVADHDNHRVRRLIPLTGTATLHGRVDGGGPSTAGVQVEVFRTFPLWASVAKTWARPDGSYAVAGLIPGPYRVRVSDPLGRFTTRWLTDAPTQRSAALLDLHAGDGPHDIVVTPRSPGTIEGTVTAGRDHAPRAGAWVQVMVASGYVTSALTGPDGRYRVSGLPTGRYRLRIVDPTGEHPREWYRDALAWATSLPVDLADDARTADVHLGPRSDDALPVVTVLAGTGTRGYSGDGGPATDALLDQPVSVAIGPDGDVWFAERGNDTIRRIDEATGIITTEAGTGTEGFAGDGGPAVDAVLRRPQSLTFDDDGNLFFVDGARVRRIDATSGVITTVAGGGIDETRPIAATSATLGGLESAVIAPDGHLYLSRRYEVVDGTFGGILRVDLATGELTVVAGGAAARTEGPALGTTLDQPRGLGIGPDGALYCIVGTDDAVVVRIELATGLLATVAGTADPSRSLGTSDHQPALLTTITSPSAPAFDAAGDLFLGADTSSGGVRWIDRVTGIIRTVPGTENLEYLTAVAAIPDGLLVVENRGHRLLAVR